LHPHRAAAASRYHRLASRISLPHRLRILYYAALIRSLLPFTCAYAPASSSATTCPQPDAYLMPHSFITAGRAGRQNEYLLLNYLNDVSPHNIPYHLPRTARLLPKMLAARLLSPRRCRRASSALTARGCDEQPHCRRRDSALLRTYLCAHACSVHRALENLASA